MVTLVHVSVCICVCLCICEYQVHMKLLWLQEFKFLICPTLAYQVIQCFVCCFVFCFGIVFLFLSLFLFSFALFHCQNVDHDSRQEWFRIQLGKKKLLWVKSSWATRILTVFHCKSCQRATTGTPRRYCRLDSRTDLLSLLQLISWKHIFYMFSRKRSRSIITTLARCIVGITQSGWKLFNSSTLFVRVQAVYHTAPVTFLLTWGWAPKAVWVALLKPLSRVSHIQPA